MKLTKIFSGVMAFLMGTAMMTACSSSDDGGDDGIQVKGLTVDPTTLTFTKDGGTKTISALAPQTATATSSAEWCVTTTGQQSAETKVTPISVVVAANNTTAERTAVITITAGKESRQVTVTQEKGDDPTPDPTPGPVPDTTATFTATAKDIAPLMVPGWNLGNTMEAIGGETAWQHTVTTQAVIDCVKAAGFNSVRIPCSWDIHSDSKGKIDTQWMNRVKEVVDYCVNDGLYVVLNDHWDNGWIEVLGFSKSKDSYQAIDEATITAKTERLKDIWTQIATVFKDYDEHLLFAGLNEPFQEYNLFNNRHQTLTPILCRYNKAFVEAVRATGGNNSQRTLVVQGPSTNIASSCQYMTADKLPEAAGRLMVEVHYYDPGQFCGTYSSKLSEGGIVYWGTANHVSGSNHNATWGEESSMKSEFAKLKTAYTSKGYPVIIGEYAANQRNVEGIAGHDQAKHDASIKLFYKCVNEYATNNGAVAFAWDTNYLAGLTTSDGSSTIIDRANAKVVGDNAMEGIKAGCAAGHWPY